ncbi:AMP-binding protein [Shewanella aegiceratis]|uniref:AMP-binding protein n=1 Tax=Shewanella aegiceratis TaxID=2864203 RepID=UPI001C656FDE|nr:AMP-binding protein [Shewanella aegiceratis]QYJ83753.1 AMP-binding protein [Shewanella aegiceratis]
MQYIQQRLVSLFLFMKNVKPMSRLINYLKRVPEDRKFLVFREKSYTFGELVKLCDDFSLEYPYLSGKNCALISADRESLALFLPVIDSVCQSLLLQPFEVDVAHLEFYQAADIDYVIRLSRFEIESVISTKIESNASIIRGKNYLIPTSGTTGSPKLASYTLEALVSTAKKDVDRGQNFIWGLTYDVNRFAGLQVYIQSIASGSVLVVPPFSLSTAELVSFFSEESVNSLSATPSFWRKILMDPSHTKLCFNRITLGGEIANQSILNALSQSFPSSEIVHIYASTEAGVGFTVKDRREGFPESYLGSNSHIKCKLKIENGILWIKSLNGCTKLLKGNLELDSGGFVNTGDMVKLCDGRVYFLGRYSGAINVGGNKVMPEKVESILEKHSLILMAKVFPKKSPVLGALVACEIVLVENLENIPLKVLKKEIVAYCRSKLEAFEVPALLKVVDAIQTNSTGKKVRS